MLAVQFLTEMQVSMQRIDAFLRQEEPPPPAHHVALEHGQGQGQEAEVALTGADYDWQRPFGHMTDEVAGAQVSLSGYD